VAVDEEKAAFIFNGASWSGPVSLDPLAVDGAPVSVSCPSSTFCVVKDAAGDVISGSLKAPTITKVSPSKGAASGGTSVKITGTEFEQVASVRFGSSAAATFKVASLTSIMAVAPPEPGGIVDISVTNAGGTSSAVTADRYKFVPTITGLSPSSGTTAGGTTVTVSGTGFAPGTTATAFKFGTSSATSVNCSSSTECTVATPAHAAGSVTVKATINHVTTAKTSASVYTYG
jgi:hypothetical protein